jgi:hypothetical protein
LPFLTNRHELGLSGSAKIASKARLYGRIVYDRLKIPQLVLRFKPDRLAGKANAFAIPHDLHGVYSVLELAHS